MRDLINVALLLLAILLMIVLAPPGILYTAYLCVARMSPRKAAGYLSASALAVAEAIDRLGGVVCRDLFNALFIKENAYQIGQNGETISYALGINKGDGTLTDVGRALANLLNFIDPHHVEKAVLSGYPSRGRKPAPMSNH